MLQRDAVRDKDRREILGNRVRVEISNANKGTTIRRDDSYGDRRYGRSPDRYGRSPERYGRSPDRVGRSPPRRYCIYALLHELLCQPMPSTAMTIPLQCVPSGNK
jgi:hypothetical protein